MQLVDVQSNRILVNFHRVVDVQNIHCGDYMVLDSELVHRLLQSRMLQSLNSDRRKECTIDAKRDLPRAESWFDD